MNVLEKFGSKITGLVDGLDMGIEETGSGDTPEILTGTRCLVVVFVEVGNKVKEYICSGGRKSCWALNVLG